MKTIHKNKNGQFYELDNGITERQLAPEGVGIMRVCLIGLIIWAILAGIAYVIWIF